MTDILDIEDLGYPEESPWDEAVDDESPTDEPDDGGGPEIHLDDQDAEFVDNLVAMCAALVDA